MDIYGAIKELEAEKKRLDGVISSLETFIAEGAIGEILQGPKPRRPRGRKIMTPEERRNVSERMRKYWAVKRSKPNA